MDTACLILVISQRLHQSMETCELVELGPTKVAIHGAKSRKNPEKHWVQDGLRKEVLLALKNFAPARARIAAHMASCFPSADSDEWQARMLQEEHSLKVETGIQDLQIWGIHHDIKRSPIWKALREVQNAVEQGRAECEAEQLAETLESAFRSMWHLEVSSRLALCWHDVLHYFQAVGLNLQAGSDIGGLHGAAVKMPAAQLADLTQRRAQAAELLERKTGGLRRCDPELISLLDDPLNEVKKSLLDGPKFAAATDDLETYWTWIDDLIKRFADMEQLASGQAQ